jgi:hypothetical protein
MGGKKKNNSINSGHLRLPRSPFAMQPVYNAGRAAHALALGPIIKQAGLNRATLEISN